MSSGPFTIINGLKQDSEIWSAEMIPEVEKQMDAGYLKAWAIKNEAEKILRDSGIEYDPITGKFSDE